MENLFKEYAKEICVNCTNPDCENGKGIHISNYNGVALAKCTEYITNCMAKRKM